MTEYDPDAFDAFEEAGWTTKEATAYHGLLGRVTSQVADPVEHHLVGPRRDLARTGLRPRGGALGDPIIGIPFTVQAFMLAGYALWPFGRTLVSAERRHRGLSAFANVLWFILAGWWLALAHLFAAIALCITIIGIPLGIASFKMAGAALVPFGNEVVSLSDLSRHPRAGAIIVVVPDPTRDA